MTPGENDELILRHLDGETSPSEIAEVTRLLRENPGFRSRFLAFVYQAARLRDILDAPAEAIAARTSHGDCPLDTEDALIELGLEDEAELAGQEDSEATIVEDLHGIFAREGSRPTPPPLPVSRTPAPRRRRRRILALAATTAVVVLAVTVFGYFFRTSGPASATIAVVDSLAGNVMLVRDDEELPVAQQLDVRQGDRFVTGSRSEFTLKYPDGTMVHIGDDAKVAFTMGRSTGAKLVTVESGEVFTRATAQPTGRLMRFETPMADANVLGTELLLSVQPKRSRLEVMEGHVELARENGEKAVVEAGHFGIATPRGLSVGRVNWPANRDGLVFLLRTNHKDEPVLASGMGRTFPLTSRGAARFDDPSTLAFSGGAYLAEDANAGLLAACQETNELAVEATVRPENLKQDGPARIIAFSLNSGSFNFVLGQSGDRLVWRLNTSDGIQSELTFYQLPDDKPHHVIVTYRDGRLVCYVDGKKVKQCKCYHGDFRDWDRRHVIFGDEWEGSRAWRGTLEDVAVYNRFIDEEEAKHNALHCGDQR